MKRALPFLNAALLLAQPALAQDADRDAYVDANVLSIFYHEFGHALIDVMDLPVFGQEEDAADTASVLLIDAFFEEDVAQDIAANAAFGFLDEAAQNAGEEPAWWDEHGPDLQRYYNLVCLFYGAAPDERQPLADTLGLPEERAENCPEEFELAYSSWGPVLEDLEATGPGKTLILETPSDTSLGRLVAAEVAALNAQLSLPEPIKVRVESCGEANAFYDLDDRSITMCTELQSHLDSLFEQN